jgi:hypothetical protein
MKKVLMLLALLLLAVLVEKPQTISNCPAGTVCFTQEQANRINKALDELVALRDAYNKLLVERGTSDAKASASQAVIDTQNEVIALDVKMFATYEQVVALYQKTLAVYADLVQKMADKINKPKSAWQKILDAAKVVIEVLAGIAIGRAIGQVVFDPDVGKFPTMRFELLGSEI